MKKLLIFALCISMAVHGYAGNSAQQALEPADPSQPMQLHFNSTNSKVFVFIIPLGKYLVPGQTYFFDTNLGMFTGIYTSSDKYGRATIAYLNRIESQAQGEIPVESADPATAPPSTGDDTSEIHGNAKGIAYRAGFARAFSRGLLDTNEQREKIEALESQKNTNIGEAAKNYETIRVEMASLEQNTRDVLNSLSETLKSNQAFVLDEIAYKSGDEKLVSELKEIEILLKQVRPTSAKRRQAKSLGLEMVQKSDEASANGDADAAQAFRGYADGFLDIAFGLDPFTGPIRDVYEAFTGKNIITGQELGNFERTFAIVGAVTFGFGSKFARGLNFFEHVLNSGPVKKSLEAALRIFKKAEREIQVVDNSAHNAAAYQKYLRELRERMERPSVQDATLQEYIKRYWRDGAEIGNGSTAAAIRSEITTGMPTKGRWHSIKGKLSLDYFEDWLRLNPNAVASDRRTVENLILDLRDAFGGFE